MIETKDGMPKEFTIIGMNGILLFLDIEQQLTPKRRQIAVIIPNIVRGKY